MAAIPNQPDMSVVTKAIEAANKQANSNAQTLNMTLADLPKLSPKLDKIAKGIDEVEGELQTGRAEDKKNKQRDAENQKETRRALLGALTSLKDSVTSAFKDLKASFGDVKGSPLMKILLGGAALIAGGVSGFVVGILEMIAKLTKLNKIFKKGGAISNFFRKIKIAIKKSKLVKFISGIFGKGGAIGKFFGKITGIFSKLPFVGQLGGIFGKGGTIAKVMGPLGKVFGTAFKFTKAIPIVGQIIALVMGVIKGIRESIDEFMAGDIIGGIGAFFGGIIEVFTFGLISTDDFKKIFEGILGNVFSAFDKLFSGDLTGFIKDMGNAIITYAVGIPELILDGIFNLLSTVAGWLGLNAVSEFFASIAEVDILSLVRDVFARLMEFAAPVLSVFEQIFTQLWNFISMLFTSLYDVVTPILNVIYSVVSTVFGIVANVFKAIYANVIQPLVIPLAEVFKSVFGVIADTLTWIYNNIVRPVLSGILYFFDILGYAFDNVQYYALLALNGIIDVVNDLLYYIPGTDYIKKFDTPTKPGGFPEFKMLDEIGGEPQVVENKATGKQTIITSTEAEDMAEIPEKMDQLSDGFKEEGIKVVKEHSFDHDALQPDLAQQEKVRTNLGSQMAAPAPAPVINTVAPTTNITNNNSRSTAPMMPIQTTNPDWFKYEGKDLAF